MHERPVVTGRWYRPGDALALVTGAGVVVTDPGQEAILATLFEEPLKVPGVVEALTARGWSAVPDFACTVVEGDEVRVLVRGRHRVEIAGEVLEGHGVTTWSERSWSRAEVGAVVVRAGDDTDEPTDEPTDAPRLPIEAGLVRASRVQWIVTPAVVTEDGEDAPSAPETSSVPEARSAPETVAEPEPEPEPVADAAPEPPPAVRAPDSPATIIEPDEHEFDAMFGVTVPGRRPEDAAVRPIEADLEDEDEDALETSSPEPSSPKPSSADPSSAELSSPEPPAPRSSSPAEPVVPEAPAAPAPMTPDTGDHDGRTVARTSLPRRPGAAPAPFRRTGPLVTLALSTGETYDVAGRALVGRSPRSTAVTGAALPQLVVVDDPYVSSTHLEIAVGAATVLVTDVSTNGTTLTPPGGTEGVLVRDVPTDAPDGSVLRLSDDLTIRLAISGGPS